MCNVIDQGFRTMVGRGVQSRQAVAMSQMTAHSADTRMNLCIIQPKLNVVSETFLKAHAERLPANVTVLHGNFAINELPALNGNPILSQGLGPRIVRKLSRIAHRRPWSWETTSALTAAFRRFRIQAVLAEYGPTGVDVSEACRLARVPLIVHFHGYDASKTKVLEAYKDAYRAMFHQASAIIGVSRAMQQRLEKLGAPPSKVACIPYGVNCDEFSNAAPGDAAPVFLSVGRFVEKKAPHLTILAFKKVHDEVPAAQLRMIGHGPLLGPCRDLVLGLGIDRAVSFLGAQPSCIVAEEMQRARAFVQHSLEASDGDCEGTPVAILEAGASGLPVVATKHAGIPDVVVDGVTGFLVAERDVEGMAAAMFRIADSPETAAKLGRAARQRIRSEYTIEHRIAQLWSVIKSSVTVGSPRAAKRHGTKLASVGASE